MLLSIAMATALAVSPISYAMLGTRAATRGNASNSARKSALSSRVMLKPSILKPSEGTTSLAVVTTDKTDYLPGETVVISGSGWMAGETVALALHREGSAVGADTELTAIADEYGNIVNKEFKTTEEHLGATFSLSATGRNSGSTASATFTDGGSMNYSPASQVLNIQSDASPQSATFSQTVSAPRGNGGFTAALDVVGTGGTPLPAAWVSALPEPLSYSTGTGTPTVFFPATRTVKVTVPPLTPAGTYTAQIKVSPSITGVGAGPGTNLTVIVTADNAPPNTSLTATTPPSNPYNGVDWTNQDVTVSLSATDTGTPATGVASTKYSIDGGSYQTYAVPFTISSEGLHSVTYFSIDNQGNTEGGHTFTVKIDKTAPSVVAVRDTAANGFGWNNGDVDVSYTATDALSGVNAGASDSTPFTLTAEGADQSHTFTVYDQAGNSATGIVSDINIDKTAPTISSSRTPVANADGWNNTDVTASYNASDALSGLDGSSPATGSFTFNVEAADQSYTFTVTDLAGNSASSTVSDVNIDKTAPAISASRTPAANGFGWNNTDVTASYNASDALSGLNASSPATGSHLFNTEGANQSHTFTVTDKAGNSSSASVSSVSIDKTAPVITITTPSDGASYLFNSSVAANFSTSDALSGLDGATQTSTTPNGGSINTSSVGSKSFTVSVTDKAGNPATKTNNYSVIYTPPGSACGGAGHVILQPINVDGTSVFKKGSTVPAKFRVYDANCASIGTQGVVTSFVLMYIGSSGNAAVNEVVDSTTPDTVFRWSPTDQQWIFNVNTKNLVAGQKYFYRITLNDGSYIDFAFSLK